MVGRDQVAAVPVVGLYDDLVTEFPLEIVDRRWRQAAELHSRPTGVDRLYPHHLLLREDADEAVQIGLPLVVVIRIPFAPDRLADIVADEPERTGAHHALLVPADVL